MALTRDFKETVQKRVDSDPEFAKALLHEAVDLMLDGDAETAKLILRDLVNATVGFERLALEMQKPSKSLHRMLSLSGNPTMRNLSDMFVALKKNAGLALQPSAWAAEVLWFEENKNWLDRSAEIALCVLNALHEKNMSQKVLAEVMGVSPRHVSKILKGTENLTLETISKLEHALGVKIVTVESHYKAFELEEGHHPKSAGVVFHQDSYAKARSVSASDSIDAYTYYLNDFDYKLAS